MSRNGRVSDLPPEIPHVTIRNFLRRCTGILTHRVALLGECLERLHHLLRLRRVQAAGGLVHEDQLPITTAPPA